jgi:hypothetical protein
MDEAREERMKAQEEKERRRVCGLFVILYN